MYRDGMTKSQIADTLRTVEDASAEVAAALREDDLAEALANLLSASEYFGYAVGSLGAHTRLTKPEEKAVESLNHAKQLMYDRLAKLTGKKRR